MFNAYSLIICLTIFGSFSAGAQSVWPLNQKDVNDWAVRQGQGKPSVGVEYPGFTQEGKSCMVIVTLQELDSTGDYGSIYISLGQKLDEKDKDMVYMGGFLKSQTTVGYQSASEARVRNNNVEFFFRGGEMDASQKYIEGVESHMIFERDRNANGVMRARGWSTLWKTPIVCNFTALIS